MGELISILRRFLKLRRPIILYCWDILQLQLVPLVGELQKVFLADADIVLFATLSDPNYGKIFQNKQRTNIIYLNKL